MNVNTNLSITTPRSDMLRKATFGNSLSSSLKKSMGCHTRATTQNFFQCKSCLFAEVSNRSHAGKAVAKFNAVNYNYKLSKFSATFTLIPLFVYHPHHASLHP
jgi:hypothetical protein